MMMYLSQLFLREFLKWQKENMTSDYDENEEKKSQELMYMIKINGMKTTAEKRAGDVKKWLFPLIDFEFDWYIIRNLRVFDANRLSDIEILLMWNFKIKQNKIELFILFFIKETTELNNKLN